MDKTFRISTTWLFHTPPLDNAKKPGKKKNKVLDTFAEENNLYSTVKWIMSETDVSPNTNTTTLQQKDRTQLFACALMSLLVDHLVPYPLSASQLAYPPLSEVHEAWMF